MNKIGENVVRIEAEALRALADRLAGPMAEAFAGAVDCLYCCGGRVVVTGMGKSGLVARKIAATLSLHRHARSLPASGGSGARRPGNDRARRRRAGALAERRHGRDPQPAADHQAARREADRHDRRS